MTVRALLALTLLAALTLDSEAGPLRRRAQSGSPTPSYQPAPAAPVTSTSFYTPAADGSATGDGLDEVNALRAARGLRPFVRDAALTDGARACAAARAARGQFGHTANDFAFLPPGASARAAGCAAYTADHGWMSCCVYDSASVAGAAWVTGGDGRRYMQLFVR